MEGNMKDSEEYVEALNKAYKEAGHNAYFGNGFGKGYDFAMAQPKHIFDGVAQVGEVRRFEDELVDVVDVAENEPSTCSNCILFNVRAVAECSVLTSCDTHNVKYIKR